MKNHAKEKAALGKKMVYLLSILAIVLSFLQVNCKRQSTAPDVDDLTRPVIWLNLFKFSFVAYEKGPNPSSQILKIKNSGQETLDYSLSCDAGWVSFLPPDGSSSGQIIEHTISINKRGLTARDEAYTATITITSSNAFNNPQNVEVSLNLDEEPPPPPPEIWVSDHQMTFSAQEGRSNPASQSLKIKNTGEGTLDYEITKNVSWLDVAPTSGKIKSGEKLHSVSVDISGLKEGNYKGTITIKDPKATNSPQKVDVSLEISKKPSTEPPLTNNEVGISISPSSGGTGTIVTVTVSIIGNTSSIPSAFGLVLHYDAAIFQYQGTSKGSLTSSWAAVDGGASAGTLTVGGFRGSGGIIPIGSQGSVAVVRFKVIYSGTTDRTTQITMNNLIDDFSGMTAKPASVGFTYIH